MARRLSRNMILGIIALIIIISIGVGSATYFLFQPAPAKAPIKIELWYNSDGHYGDTEPAVALAVKSALEQTGRLSVTLKSEPWAVYTDDFGNGNLPFFLLGWYPDYFDSDDYVSPFLGAAGAASLGSRYNDTQMEQLLAQEAAATNQTQRASLFSQIQDKLGTDVPYIPLWQGNAHVAYDKDITGVYLHPVVFKYFVMGKPSAAQLTVGTTDRLVSLDPARGYDYFSISMINQIFDTLLVYHTQNATLLPGLATEVPTVANGGVSSDGKTYTFHLRTGVTFSDGQQLNSTVVKQSIIRAIRLDLPSSAAFLLYDVAKLTSCHCSTETPTIDTPDATTIVFHLTQPVSFFNQIMAFSISAPVPLTYSQTGAQPDTAGQVIGTGPYMLTGLTPNQQLVLDRNPSYYNPGLYSSYGIPSIPVIPKVLVNQFSDAIALKQAIVTHSINLAYRTLNPVDVVDLQTRASTLNLKVDLGTSPQIRYLVFNVKKAPFTDVKLRQAIAYAVDRSLIKDVVFSSLVTPLYSMLPPSLPFSKPVFQTVYGSNPDLTKAKDLLSQLSLSLPILQVADAASRWF